MEDLILVLLETIGVVLDFAIGVIPGIIFLPIVCFYMAKALLWWNRKQVKAFGNDAPLDDIGRMGFDNGRNIPTFED